MITIFIINYWNYLINPKIICLLIIISKISFPIIKFMNLIQFNPKYKITIYLIYEFIIISNINLINNQYYH